MAVQLARRLLRESHSAVVQDADIRLLCEIVARLESDK